MNLVLFVNGAVKPYVDWLENRKRYGFPWYESRKISEEGQCCPTTGPHAQPSHPYSGLFYRRVILTLKFIPHELNYVLHLLKKNSGVIYVGIQYFVVFSGVTFTPVLGIQKNIISCVVRA
jgi:hypothetical protein